MLRFQIAQGSSFHKLSHGVINRSLNLLNARNVIGANDNRVFRNATADDLSSVTAEQTHREQSTLTCLFESQYNVTRASAGRDSNCHVVRTGMRNQLA